MEAEVKFPISKLLLILIKYIPIIQMFVMILNNILSYMDVDNSVLYLFDFATGNSLLFILLMLLLSYKLGYCSWHRYLILGNFINICVVILDAIGLIPFDNIIILLFYCTVASISIAIATYSHIKSIKRNESDIKINTSRACKND